jgi:CRISPR system Cascade subunit CasE
MTHLAQINLDFATVAHLQIRDAYDWHQRVWQCFPGRDGKQRDFLTRLDTRPEGFRLLIVSPINPVRPDWCPQDSEHWKVRPIPDDYFKRRCYAFQLCANPTKKIAVQNADGSRKKNGRRVPLSNRVELLSWITRKGKQGGFTVDDETLHTFSHGREYFSKNGIRGLHSAVEFEGVLTVIDSKRFCEVFKRGIGPAKAFGFGLLVIAPIA